VKRRGCQCVTSPTAEMSSFVSDWTDLCTANRKSKHTIEALSSLGTRYHDTLWCWSLVLIKLYAVERPTSLMEQDLGPTPCVMAPHPWCHRRAIQAGRAWATVDLPAKFANAPDKQWVQMVSELGEPVRKDTQAFFGLPRVHTCGQIAGRAAYMHCCAQRL
jgi:hypothetical protein